MVIQSEPTPYAKYRLRHYGYNSETGRNDYEDVKVRPPTLQTTVTFGEGLKTPSDLFGSLKKAGQRFVGAEKLVQGQFRNAGTEQWPEERRGSSLPFFCLESKAFTNSGRALSVGGR